MGNDTTQNKDQDTYLQDKDQRTNSEEANTNNDFNKDTFLNDNGLPSYGTTMEDANSNGTLSDYDEDKKNTEMEEGLENRVDTEDNNPDDDKVDFEEEEEEEELDSDDDIDNKYFEEEEEEEEEEDEYIDYDLDYNDGDSEENMYNLLQDNFRRYNSIFDSYNFI